MKVCEGKVGYPGGKMKKEESYKNDIQYLVKIIALQVAGLALYLLLKERTLFGMVYVLRNFGNVKHLNARQKQLTTFYYTPVVLTTHR